ncbi:MAG: hypothetical protein R2867_12400 [Caldilineaceae bacterium]
MKRSSYCQAVLTHRYGPWLGDSHFFIAKGDGAYMTDVDGNRYVDYVMSWGR